MVRVEFIFSNWIFVWYVAYVLGLTKFNPKMVLILGIIHNICLSLVVLYFTRDYLRVIIFCVGLLLYKGVPLWTVRHAAYRLKDFYALVVYFLIFTVWLSVNGRLKIIDVNSDFLSNLAQTL